MDQDETCHAGGHRPWPHCFRWGPSSPSPKGTQPPIFGPCLLWPNGWVDQDATWYGDCPWPKPHCVRWGPNSTPGKRGIASNFRPMSIVAKRSPISSTAEHFLNTGCPYYTGQTTFRCYQPLFQEQLRVAVTALHASTKSSIHGTSLVP